MSHGTNRLWMQISLRKRQAVPMTLCPAQSEGTHQTKPIWYFCLPLILFLCLSLFSVSQSVYLSLSVVLSLFLVFIFVSSLSPSPLSPVVFHIIRPGCLLVPTCLPVTVLSFKWDWQNPLSFKWQTRGVGTWWPSIGEGSIPHASVWRGPWNSPDSCPRNGKGPLSEKGLWVRQAPPEMFAIVTKTISALGERGCSMWNALSCYVERCCPVQKAQLDRVLSFMYMNPLYMNSNDASPKTENQNHPSILTNLPLRNNKVRISGNNMRRLSTMVP